MSASSKPMGPSTESTALLSTPQYFDGMQYNMQIDYSDGTSIIGNITDGNDVQVYSSNGTWSAWNLRFSLGSDGNVYLTAEATAVGSSTPPTPTPAPTNTPYPIPSKGCGTKTICGNGVIQPQSVTCTAVTAFAGVVGAVLFTGLSEGTAIAVGAVVGSVLGPEGTVAGAMFGSYAVAALGLTTYSSLLGGAVFTVLGDSLCDNISDNPNPSVPAGGAGSKGDNPFTPPNLNGYQFADGATTFGSCCYPMPGATGGLQTN